jgi:hypothetical protein
MPDKIQNMRHRISCSYLTVILIALLGVSAPVLSNTPARVALIADKTFDLDKSPLVSLVEVKLSQKEGIELLERAEIDKLLQEQQLSVAGLLQRHNALKAGRLLRVDAFLLISTEPDKDQKQNIDKLLRVRLVETAHGLRLMDSFETQDSAKFEDTVKRITEKVIAAAPKMMLPHGKLIPVGIIDIHRVQLSERYQWLVRALLEVLSVRLSKELRIIMLEREDLKILHDEKLFTEGKDAEFWNSAILIDGYLQRGGTSENIEMKLRLRRASGGKMPIFTVPVEPNEPSVTVEKATNDIIQELLNAPPASSWQPKQEAQEFFRQGQLLKNHKRHKDALAMLETAHALQPQNVFYTGSLFENEWQARFIPANSSRVKETGISYYSDLELAEIVSLLVRQIRFEYEKGSLPVLYVLEQWGKPLGLERFLRGYFSRYPSVSTDKIRAMNQENRRIWAKTIQKAMSDNLPADYRWRRNGMLVRLAWSSSDIPEELMKILRDTIGQFILPPEIGGQIESPARRFHESRWMVISPEIGSVTIKQLEKTHLRGRSKTFQTLWVQYLEELTETDDPVLRFVGYAAICKLSRYGSIAAQDCCKRALEVLLAELNSPNEPMGDGYKKLIRGEMLDCVRKAGFDGDKAIDIFETLYNPLIEKKDAHNLALWHPVYSSLRLGLSRDSEKSPRYINLLDRMVRVLQNCKHNEETSRALILLKDRAVEIRDKYPELRPVTKPTSPGLTMLIRKKDWPQKNTFKYLRVLLQDNMLWIAFAEPGVGLTGIDLSERKFTSLWQTDCDKGTVIHQSAKGRKISGSITGIAAIKDACYVAIRDIGLVEFPGSLVSGREFLEIPKILTEEDGLPSVSITATAGLGNDVWIAYGGSEKESGLVKYQPRQGTCETVFCSTLKGDTPFQDGTPYVISSLAPAPENKLFFLVGERIVTIGIKYAMTQWWGLWKIDTRTKEPKFLWHDMQTPLVLENIDDCGHSWWLRDLRSLLRFNPDSETTTFIIGWSRVLRKADPMPRLNQDLFVPESYLKEYGIGFIEHGLISLRTAAVSGDKLWARSGKNQLITIHRGKGFEEAEIIYNNILNGGKVLRFFSTPYGLIAIGEGTVGLIETSDKKE